MARRLEAFATSSDEEDGDGKVSLLTSYSKDGHRTSNVEEKQIRVIPLPSSTLDWRQDRRRRVGLQQSDLKDLGPLVSMRGTGVQSSSSKSVVDDVDKIDSEGQKRGLQFHTSTRAVIEEPLKPAAASPPPSTMTEDQEAMKALLSGNQTANSTTTNGNLVIAQQQDEGQMLQHDIGTRPEAPTLDDYAAVPIEQFGMAMLRGMGWSENSKSKAPNVGSQPKKRASLLGLGAKERPSPSHSSQHHKHRERDRRYTPITKRTEEDGGSRRSRDRSASPPSRRHSSHHHRRR